MKRLYFIAGRESWQNQQSSTCPLAVQFTGLQKCRRNFRFTDFDICFKLSHPYANIKSCLLVKSLNYVRRKLQKRTLNCTWLFYCIEYITSIPLLIPKIFPSHTRKTKRHLQANMNQYF